MIFDLLRGDSPSEHAVALLTVRAHFPLVNIGMAVLARFADIGERRLGVALLALHLFVHAVQRILGLVMVKLKNAAYRAPALGCVAVFTRDVQVTMGAARSLLRNMRGHRGNRV